MIPVNKVLFVVLEVNHPNNCFRRATLDTGGGGDGILNVN